MIQQLRPAATPRRSLRALHALARTRLLHCLNILGEPVQNQSRFVDATDVGYIDPSAAKRAFKLSSSIVCRSCSSRECTSTAKVACHSVRNSRSSPSAARIPAGFHLTRRWSMPDVIDSVLDGLSGRARRAAPQMAIKTGTELACAGRARCRWQVLCRRSSAREPLFTCALAGKKERSPSARRKGLMGLIQCKTLVRVTTLRTLAN